MHHMEEKNRENICSRGARSRVTNERGEKRKDRRGRNGKKREVGSKSYTKPHQHATMHALTTHSCFSATPAMAATKISAVHHCSLPPSSSLHSPGARGLRHVDDVQAHLVRDILQRRHAVIGRCLVRHDL